MNVRYWRKSKEEIASVPIKQPSMHQALTSPPLARDAVKKRRSRRRRKILIGLGGGSAASDHRFVRGWQAREADPGDD